MDLKIELLGGITIRYNEIPLIGFVSSKTQALLCYLAITGQAYSRSKLAALFWSDRSEAKAQANLRVALTNMRQLIAPYLTITRQTVAFNPQPGCYLDVTHFQAGCQAIGVVQTQESIACLQQAVAVYQGDLMAGFHIRGAPMFDEWLLIQRENLHQQSIQALYTLSAYHTTRGEYTVAIDYTRRLLRIEPWHEESHRQLMLLLALSGQRSHALAQYEICYRMLRDELSVMPSDETKTLYQHILGGQFNYVNYAPRSPEIPPGIQPNTWNHLERLPLVGRGTEYAWLFQQWQAACYYHGRLTLVEGAVGSGKTRLVEEVLRHAAGMGTRLFTTRCTAFEDAVPYQPISAILRSLLQNSPSTFNLLAESWLLELAYLLPEIHECYPRLVKLPIATDDTTRHRLFEAIARTLETLVTTTRASVAFFFDDLHYADPATIDVLRYLTDRLQHSSIWWVGTTCQVALPETNQPLLRLRYDLARSGQVAHLCLPALDMPAIAQLVAQLPGLAHTQADLLTTYLYTCSEGNAFILAQFLQELQQRNILLFRNNTGFYLDTHQLTHQAVPVPAGVCAMIQQAVQVLQPYARTVLDVAAAIGRNFDLQVLERAADLTSTEFYRALELLLEHHLIRVACASMRPNDGEYEFTYHIMQYILSTNFSWGRQQQLHAQIAQAYAQLERTFMPLAHQMWPDHTDRLSAV